MAERMQMDIYNIETKLLLRDTTKNAIDSYLDPALIRKLEWVEVISQVKTVA